MRRLLTALLTAALLACACGFAATGEARSLYSGAGELPAAIDVAAYEGLANIDYVTTKSGDEISEGIFHYDVALEVRVDSLDENRLPSKLYTGKSVQIGQGFACRNEAGKFCNIYFYPVLHGGKIEDVSIWKAEEVDTPDGKYVITNGFRPPEYLNTWKIAEKLDGLADEKVISKENPVYFYDINGIVAVTRDGKHAWVLSLKEGEKEANVTARALATHRKGGFDADAGEPVDLMRPIEFDAAQQKEVAPDEINEALCRFFAGKGFDTDGLRFEKASWSSREDEPVTWKAESRDTFLDPRSAKAFAVYLSAKTESEASAKIIDYSFSAQADGLGFMVDSWDRESTHEMIAQECETIAARQYNAFTGDLAYSHISTAEVPLEAHAVAQEICDNLKMDDSFEWEYDGEPVRVKKGLAARPRGYGSAYTGYGFAAYRADNTHSNTYYIPLYVGYSPAGMARVDYKDGEYTGTYVKAGTLLKKLGAAQKKERCTETNPMYIYNTAGFCAVSADGKRAYYLGDDESNKGYVEVLALQARAARLKDGPTQYKETVRQLRKAWDDA